MTSLPRRWRSLLCAFSKPARFSRANRHALHRRRLAYEPLEDRRLLSVVPYVVNSLDDVVATDGKITLREALVAANINAPVCDAHAGSSTESDIIAFALPPGDNRITLGGSELEITDDLLLLGPGADRLTIDAAGGSRIFSIAADTEALIYGLTITGGSADDGGGIYNSGTLSVINSTLSANAASGSDSDSGFGGGIYNNGTLTVTNSALSDNSANGVHGQGGGIYDYGTLTVTNSTLSGNSANYLGGGICSFWTLTIANSTFSGNAAELGGAIANEGTATVTDSTLSGNSAGSGGGIFVGSWLGGTLILTNSTLSGNSAERGGGIDNWGTASVTNSTLSGNSATHDGGAIYTNPDDFHQCAFTVTDSTLVNNSAGGKGGAICNDTGTLTVTDSILSANHASIRGGAIYSDHGAVTVVNSTFSDNSATGAGGLFDGGGAIYGYYGTLSIADSTFLRNSTGSDAGGGALRTYDAATTISNSVFSENVASEPYGCGSGIYLDYGTLAISQSTFSDNTSYDGVIFNQIGTVTIANSTFSGNSASGLGGAIYNYFNSTLILTRSTITGNSAYYYGGGIWNGGTLTVTDSVICGNSTVDKHGGGGGIFGLGDRPLIIASSTVAANSSAVGGGIWMGSSSPLTVTNSLIALNSAPSDPDVHGSLTPESGFNLIGVDPLFVRNPNPGSGDYGDLRLTAASPAVNGGSNALLSPDSQDLDGDGDTNEPLPIDLAANPRVIYGTVDIGAYEYWLAGDLNLDRFVGADDLDIVRANWGQQVTAGDWLHGDASGDGFVGAADLDIVRSNWGQVVPAPPVVPALQPLASKVIQAASKPVPHAHDVVLAHVGGQDSWNRKATVLAELGWAWQREHARASEGNGPTQKARELALLAYAL